MALNDIHVRDNQNYKIINNVKRYFELYNGKKNLLYVVQADFREDANDHIGGTQKHVKDLSLNLCKEYNIFVATRYGQYLIIPNHYIWMINPYIKKKSFSFLSCI